MSTPTAAIVTPTKRFVSLSFIAVSVVSTAPMLAAEAASSSPGGTITSEEKTIELTPFVVASDKDVGYLAGNSLSGSRMDIKLKDTAASISVLTEEFIRDIGATNLSEVIGYTNNTQLDLGESGGFGSGLESNAVLEFEPRYRARGLPATVGRNYFAWTVPTDTYNVGRVEESRGPNSILFGVGSAGGIINVSTKEGMIGRTIRKFSFAAGSFESWRGAVDFNQPLNKQSAVRLNAVWDKSNTYRHWAHSENRRAHLAVKYRPTTKTQLRAEYEFGRVQGNTPRQGTITDQSTPWINAGRPTFAATAPNTAFTGLGTRLAATTLRYISNSDRVVNMGGQILTSAPPLTGDLLMIDPSLSDPSINVGGPAQQRDNRFRTGSVYFEQQLARKTFVEIALNHQYYDFESYDPRGANAFFGDPNPTLPGTLGSNPFARAALLEANWVYIVRAESANAVRASLSQEVDVGKWGRYRGAVLADYRRRRYDNQTYFETFAGAPFNPTPENAANRVTRRTYLTQLGDWPTYYINGPATTGLIRNLTDPITGRTLSSAWINADNMNNDITIHRSILGGLQASYFGGRLVGGAGYRHDDVMQKDRNTIRNPSTNLIEVDYGNVRYVHNFGRTVTLGVVGHVTSNLSVLYNQSKNVDVANPNIRVLPNEAVGTPPKGKGQDYGFALDLFDGKVYARAVRFTTELKGELGFGGAAFQNRNNQMLNALLTARLITQAEFDARTMRTLNGTTRDKTNEGYEISLTANPTRQWRFQANFSITDGVEDRIIPEIAAWWTATKPYFTGFPQNIQTGTGTNTIATTIVLLEDEIAALKATEGVGLVGNRKYKANFFTRYTFASDWAKGFYVGAGYRYLGEMLVGRYPNGALQYAPPVGEASLLVGREFKLWEKCRLRVQLNVANLFDETDPIIARYQTTGDLSRPRAINTRAPRTWRLTTDLDF